MRQHSKTTFRWIPVALALGLLAACSQSPQTHVSEAPSPIAAEPEASPLPTAIAPLNSKTPSLSASVRPSQLPIASTPAQSAPIKESSSPPIASAPAAKPLPLERTPTFRATPRMTGFSPDSNYFIYLESSQDTGAGVPQSALQLVKLDANRCLEAACVETHYSEKEAGMKMSEAETELLKQTWKVRQDLNLTPPVAGINLPIVSRSRKADGSETVVVQLNDRNLQLHLQQKSTQDKASMRLGLTYDGQQRSLDSLSNFRDNVLDYSIRQVKLSPDGKRVAVLITATKPTFEGTLGTTLVQGFAL